jgi:hypothetical protein
MSGKVGGEGEREIEREREREREREKGEKNVLLSFFPIASPAIPLKKRKASY